MRAGRRARPPEPTEAAIFRRLVVWLDDLAPQRGAFAHALDWARRWQQRLQVTPTPDLADVARRLQACTDACGRGGVTWELLPAQDPAAADLLRSLTPSDLCVLGREAPPALKRTLLRQALWAPGPAALFCPDDAAPPGRLLLLCRDGAPGGPLLDAIAELCRRLQATPIVLTVAPTEGLARARQQAARAALARHGLAAEFDLVAGSDARAAAAGVARWRRCGLVVVERPLALSWWRWLRGDTLERLAGLAESVSLLTLPGAGAPAPLSSDRASPAPAPPGASPEPAFH